MSMGKHETTKSVYSPTYNSQWSGVSYAPHARGIRCEVCKHHLHEESDSLYCPRCDDFRHGEKGYPVEE